jgi:tetratricopeptide (TPR) repeat protein
MQELERARLLLTNNPKVYELAAYIERRQGHWDSSATSFEQALQLDPRNFFILQQISLSYHYLRRYRDMAQAIDRALSIVPQDIDCRVTRAYVDLEERGDTQPLHDTIYSILSRDPTLANNLADQWLYLALCERDFTEANRALAAIPPTGILVEGISFSHAWCGGMIARASGNQLAAKDAMLRARQEQEAVIAQ